MTFREWIVCASLQGQLQGSPGRPSLADFAEYYKRSGQRVSVHIFSCLSLSVFLLFFIESGCGAASGGVG